MEAIVRLFSQLFLFLFMSLSISSFAGELNPNVKAYKEWKAEKIQQVQSKLSQIKVTLEGIKIRRAEAPVLAKAKGYDSLIQRYEKDLAQEKWNLDVASDLSVTDYVVLYLSHQSSKTKFQEAASQLSVSDIAEMMEAYSESLDASNPAPTLSSTVSPAGKAVGPASASLSPSR